MERPKTTTPEIGAGYYGAAVSIAEQALLEANREGVGYSDLFERIERVVNAAFPDHPFSPAKFENTLAEVQSKYLDLCEGNDRLYIIR